MQLLNHEGKTDMATWLLLSRNILFENVAVWVYITNIYLYLIDLIYHLENITTTCSLFSIINDNLSTTLHIVIKPYCVRLGLGCLTPLSTIFQLYHGCQFHWWRKPEYLDHGVGCLYWVQLVENKTQFPE